MQLLEKLIKIVAPHSCLGCGVEGDRLLCEACQQDLAEVPSRCYRCKAVTDNYETCLSCRQATPLKQVVVFAHHTGLVKDLTHRMKYERAQAGVYEAAQLLQPRLPYLSGTDSLIVHVPTATGRVRARGYDHAKLLARAVSGATGLTHTTLLARLGQAHQVGANRAQRLRQLENAFRPLKLPVIKGAHIVLVDDVLTTGATLETAARVLRQAGARRVDAVILAQAD